MAVERLVDAAQRRKEGEGLPPPDAAFDDHAVDIEDLLVEMLEEEDPGEGLRGQVEAEIGEQLVARQRGVLEEVGEGGLGLLLVGAREDDRVVLLGLYRFHVA